MVRDMKVPSGMVKCVAVVHYNSQMVIDMLVSSKMMCMTVPEFGTTQRSKPKGKDNGNSVKEHNGWVKLNLLM